MTGCLVMNANKLQLHVGKTRLSIYFLDPEIKAPCTNCTIYPAAGSKNLSCWELRDFSSKGQVNNLKLKSDNWSKQKEVHIL